MENDEKFCCWNIKSWATIVAVVGIILSGISLLTGFVSWIFLPSGLSLLLAFIFVLVGTNKSLYSLLSIAIVIIILNIFVEMFHAVMFFLYAANVTQGDVDRLNNSSKNGKLTKTETQIGYIIFAAINLLVVGLLVFACFVIHKTRRFLIQNPRRFSHFSDGAPPRYSSSEVPPGPYPPFGHIQGRYEKRARGSSAPRHSMQSYCNTVTPVVPPYVDIDLHNDTMKY